MQILTKEGSVATLAMSFVQYCEIDKSYNANVELVKFYITSVCFKQERKIFI